MKLSSRDIADACGVRERMEGSSGRVVTDTRKLLPGDWFLALKGPNFDGNALASQAREKGCAGAVLEHEPEVWDRGLVVVEDGLTALQDCARAVRRSFEGPVVGITGSSGKTTTRAMVASVLAQRFSTHQTSGNLNNHIGVPLTLLDLEPSHEILVLEMGMSGPGEIDLLQEIGAPTLRLITNVSLAHAEGSGNLEQTAACKEELFAGARPGDTLIVNADDPMVAAMSLPSGTRRVRYGSSTDVDFQLMRVTVDSVNLCTSMVANTPQGRLEVVIPAPGRHIAVDALSAAAIGHELGLSLAEIARGLQHYRPVGMRMRIEQLPGGVTLLNDAYNANPASTLASLETLASIQGRRRIALLGDMLELGQFEATSHREVMEAALASGIERVGFVGPRFGAVVKGRLETGRVHHTETSEEMGRWVAGLLQNSDVLLLKGSRGLAMERVLHELKVSED
ncbi:MAG: UDP-N-acetylmuramoyl-tripeptide--D-alanyl-D-alanine ligase [Myxococcota bacterium]|nr:UDP-N-acetylmuramoyl-tripeptide--D-alanyl-D-alanine ligase [Myxococcota bacterium]